VLLLGALVGRAVAGDPAEASGAKMLWEIGKADNDTRELALAPKGHDRFGEDPVFVVGRSAAKKDWPYVHPGPTDTWAGGRQHTFSIAFGLKAAPKGGKCRLILDLVDTHGKAPPRLRVSVNGHAVELRTPRGAGDASVLGEPEKGKEHRVVVPFPAGQLRAGTNEIAITTLSGSWVLYDWLALEAPAGLELVAAGRHDGAVHPQHPGPGGKGGQAPADGTGITPSPWRRGRRRGAGRLVAVDEAQAPPGRERHRRSRARRRE